MLSSCSRAISQYHLPLIILIIAGITFVAYLPVRTFDFVAWDDVIHVYQNRYFEPITAAHLLHFWIRPYYSLYIPLSYMVFAGLCQIAHTTGNGAQVSEFNCGLDPHIFHTANLILHIVNVILVFFLIRKAIKSPVPAAFGAMLFALHPLQVESVAWISELRGLLCCALGLASVLIYQSHRENQNVWLARRDLPALILFALALLAKPAAVMIPLAAVIWETLFFHQKLRTTLIRLSPWLLLSAADTWITHCIQPVMAVVVMPIQQRAIIALDTVGFYIEKLAWPANLSIEYGRSTAAVIHDHSASTTVLCVAAAFAFVFLLRHRFPWSVPSALTFLVFLIPNSGIVPFAYQFYSTVADRYMYLAMLGPAFACAYFLDGLKTSRSKLTGNIGASVIVTVLLMLTVHQVSTWRCTWTLFQNAITVNDEAWLPHKEIGDECILRKDWIDAEKQYRYVVAEGPDDAGFSLTLGNILVTQSKYAAAIPEFDRSVRISPGSSPALYSRAHCEALLGDSAHAIADYRAALKTLPATTYADYELAMELGSIGRYTEAIPELNRTIARHPDYLLAYYYLALTYSKMGRPHLAADAARMALARNSNDAAVMPFVAMR